MEPLVIKPLIRIKLRHCWEELPMLMIIQQDMVTDPVPLVIQIFVGKLLLQQILVLILAFFRAESMVRQNTIIQQQRTY